MMTSAGQEVDVAILGAGGGGYPAAFLLAKAGLRVVMADPLGNLGGDCLAEGCVPSKAVREAGLARASARKYTHFGLHGETASADWPSVLAFKDRVQKVRYENHRRELHDSSILFHAGKGRLTGERQLEIETQDAVHRYTFRYLLLATGSRPTRLRIPGAELAVTSHDFFRLGADLPFPRQLVVIGGGYIGVEVASMLQNLGGQATVLEYTSQLLPGFDAELAQALYASLGQRVSLQLKAEVTAIEKVPEGFKVHYRQDEQDRSVIGDRVLMATGRAAVLPEGIEVIGLRADEALSVNDRLQTTNPAVYAPGDVNGRSMLFHSAVRQSLIAAHNILAGGQPIERMDFESVPFTVFTEPELAHVGLTEVQARERYGNRIEVIRADYAADARAQILDETKGFLKLVFESQSGRLLGAQIAGVEAAQLIAPLALAVDQGLTGGALSRVAFPHPMLSEQINKAARAFKP
jgi:dihydrolipoamide dehydrogenase